MAGESAEVLAAKLAEPPIIKNRYAGHTSSTETILAELLADILRVDRVSVDSHFFDDLGADSLMMAQFCARVRKRSDLPPVSMKDIYRHPTVSGLAAALADNTLTSNTPTAVAPPVPPSLNGPAPASTLRYVFCGALQALIFLTYAYLVALAVISGLQWVAAGSDLIQIYLRSILFGVGAFFGLCAFPVVAKWLLIGRSKPSEFPVWGLTYLRFWTVKALLHANPMIMFVDTPLYALYLRALGARIGKRVTILSHTPPVCADLLTIGAGTVIRKEAIFTCYRAYAGRIQTGPVTLGRDVFVGEKTVLDIDTSMGDGAQLGHASTLQRGEVVPAGQRWHGSPAQRTELDYLRVAPARCGTLRRVGYALLGLLGAVFVVGPSLVTVVYVALAVMPELPTLLDPDFAVASGWFYRDALILSSLLFFVMIVVGLAFAFTVPRILSLAIKPDKVYPLYGFHYTVSRMVRGMTNIKFFMKLFGDSSYVLHYLSCLGYDISLAEQTGSNFGQEVQHDTPYLTSIGRGTMSCDGLSIVNNDYSSTSFRVAPVSIGPHNFLGNHIVFPAGGRTGDNCLLATMVMVPLDGEVREGTGLLGAPCFEIPRSVERDSRFDHLRVGEERRRRLAAKNRYNIRTMGWYLFIQWLSVFLLTIVGFAAADFYDVLGAAALTVDMVLSLVVVVVYFVLVEHVLRGFRALRPQFCSIYDPYYWWHERLWKAPDEYFEIFNGTPFKNVIWRMLGVRLGRRVFDDGCYFTERTLTTIGDDCTLNAGSKIQCHSMEDGTFKSAHTTIGSGCTLGIGSFVHYGVTMGDGAVLAPHAFLMKGAEVPPHAQWGGNPAGETYVGAPSAAHSIR